ncbi:MAG: hypothetical protein WB791_04480 [Waddliaceae bacterium]
MGISIKNSLNNSEPPIDLLKHSDDESSDNESFGLFEHSDDESSEIAYKQQVDPEQPKKEDPSQDDMRFSSDLLDLFIRALQASDIGYEIHKTNPTIFRYNNANSTKSKTEHKINIYLKEGAKEVALFTFRIQKLENTEQKVKKLTISYFMDINVEKDYQGKHIATKIIDAYMRVLKEKEVDVDIDYLHIVSENPNVAGIYWGKGYRFTLQSKKQLEEAGGEKKFLDDSSKSRDFIPYIEMVRFPNGQDHLPQKVLEMKCISEIRDDFISFSG